jgi:hypothetical protein
MFVGYVMLKDIRHLAIFPCKIPMEQELVTARTLINGILLMVFVSGVLAGLFLDRHYNFCEGPHYAIPPHTFNWILS